MSRIIVERSFTAPPSDADLAAFAQRQQGCLDIYRVEHRRSLLSQDRLRMMCEYEAPDAESVRRVQNEAEGLYERIWVAEIVA
ncbi:MAG TPA: nickel-binding protein [Acetobacteraceae bacterium]|nr:nickel-binding protein [Acetobacteraceae bacterium]